MKIRLDLSCFHSLRMRNSIFFLLLSWSCQSVSESQDTQTFESLLKLMGEKPCRQCSYLIIPTDVCTPCVTAAVDFAQSYRNDSAWYVIGSSVLGTKSVRLKFETSYQQSPRLLLDGAGIFAQSQWVGGKVTYVRWQSGGVTEKVNIDSSAVSSFLTSLTVTH
jgi:hypothetical protein